MSDEYIWPPPLSDYDKTQEIIKERDELQKRFDLVDKFLAEAMISLKDKTAEVGKWQQTAEMLYFSCKRARESGEVSPLEPAIRFYETAKVEEDNKKQSLQRPRPGLIDPK
jgi:hypothetical protein